MENKFFMTLTEGYKEGRCPCVYCQCFYWTVKKKKKEIKMNKVGVQCMCCRFPISYSLQLYDIGITLHSQSTNIPYIQKHSYRRKDKNPDIK